MQQSRHHAPKITPALLAALVLAVPALASSTMPEPTHLDGRYDADTEILTLTWDWNPDIAVDGFRVYIDGVSVGEVTEQEYEDNLDDFGGGLRTYQVAAVVGAAQGNRSAEYSVFFTPGDPIFPCAILGTSIEPDEVPPVWVLVNPQCLPMLFDGGSG